MTYIPSLHKIQIAAEAVYGDAAAGTIQPPGILTFNVDPRVEVEQLKDKRGITAPAVETFVKRRFSQGNMTGYVNYNEFYHYLDGMFGIATPVGDVRTYVGSMDWASEVEKSLAIRYGQTDLLYLVPGVLPYELRISGSSGEPLRFGYRFFGRPIEDGASFAVLSDDVVDWAFAYHSTLFLDDGLAAAPGASEMTDLGFRFEMVINANRQPLWHLGNQEHDAWNRGKWGGSCRLVLEADATLLGYLGDQLDATAVGRSYAVRVRTTDGSNILDLDHVGTVVKPPTLIPDLDGVVTVELDLEPIYGSNAAIESCWAAELTIP